MRPSLLAAATVLAGLTACGAADTGAGVAPSTAGGPAAGASPSTSTAGTSTARTTAPRLGATTAPAATAGTYITYADYTGDPARYAGGRVVLFFHAPWCPNCRANEQDITARVAAGALPAGLTIVKVDYDSSTDLKAAYGIVQQDTFVPVDAAGKAVGARVTDPRGVDGLVRALG